MQNKYIETNESRNIKLRGCKKKNSFKMDVHSDKCLCEEKNLKHNFIHQRTRKKEQMKHKNDTHLLLK